MTATLALGKLKQEDPWFLGQPRLHSKALSQKQNKPHKTGYCCTLAIHTQSQPGFHTKFHSLCRMAGFCLKKPTPDKEREGGK